MPLIPTDDEPEEDVLGQSLPEDNGTPFSPPSSLSGDATEDLDRRIETAELDDTHPSYDANIIEHDVYDGGPSDAAEAGEPNVNNAVTNYDPDKDERKQDAV